jgi:hypothetical protein
MIPETTQIVNNIFNKANIYSHFTLKQLYSYPSEMKEKMKIEDAASTLMMVVKNGRPDSLYFEGKAYAITDDIFRHRLPIDASLKKTAFKILKSVDGSPMFLFKVDSEQLQTIQTAQIVKDLLKKANINSEFTLKPMRYYPPEMNEMIGQIEDPSTLLMVVKNEAPDSINFKGKAYKITNDIFLHREPLAPSLEKIAEQTQNTCDKTSIFLFKV